MKFYKRCNPFSQSEKKKEPKKTKPVPFSDDGGIRMRRDSVDAIEDYFWKNKLDTVDASDFYPRYPVK